MTSRKQPILPAESLRRLRDTWRAAGPSDFEIARAYQRFRARRSAGPSALQILRWCAVGIVAGVVVMRLSSFIAPRSGVDIIAEPVQGTPAMATVASPPISASAVAAEPVPQFLAPVRVTARAPAPPAPSAPTPVPVLDERRDNDALARAELWLAVGRGKDAQPILSGLEHHGATDAIRKRAAELAGKNERP